MSSLPNFDPSDVEQVIAAASWPPYSRKIDLPTAKLVTIALSPGADLAQVEGCLRRLFADIRSHDMAVRLFWFLQKLRPDNAIMTEAMARRHLRATERRLSDAMRARYNPTPEDPAITAKRTDLKARLAAAEATAKALRAELAKLPRERPGKAKPSAPKALG